MNQLSMSFRSIEITIEDTSSKVTRTLEKLSDDFSYFRKPDISETPNIYVRLQGSGYDLSQLTSRLPKIFRFRQCQTRGWGNPRVCDYGNGLIVHSYWHGSVRCFDVYWNEDTYLHETCYTLILSAVGEELDKLGFHRAHALGFALKSTTGLLLAPSGCGKSSTAVLLVQNDENSQIFSDESPLLKDGLVYPFPVRAALATSVADVLGLPDAPKFQRRCFSRKQLYPFPESRVSDPKKLNAIFIGRKTQGKPQIRKLYRVQALFPLLLNVVVGWGLAQMAEHMLRANSIHHLIRIAGSRLYSVVQLLLSDVEVFEFQMSANALQNAPALHEFILRQAQDDSNQSISSVCPTGVR